MTASEAIRSAGILWQHEKEFVGFCEWLAANHVTSILEIGTGYGGSAYVFSQVLPGVRIVSVDFDKRHTRTIPNFTQILGSSRTDAVEIEVSHHAPFDLVFLDTEHPYEECEENFRRYSKYATKFIAQHDINADEEAWPDMGIPRFWREVVAKKDQSWEWIAPAPDPRFPRWGGIGAVLA